MKQKLSITVTDGPYRVEGASSIEYGGASLDASQAVFLCRCGESKNPPFCDGAHRSIGFYGTSSAGAARPLKVWEGKDIKTVFNPNACMQVFLCQPLAELRARQEQGDIEAAQEIIRVVRSCPSGALNYEITGEVPEPPKEAGQPDLSIQLGGEIRVQTEFSLNQPLLEGQSSDRATLCRCGQSKNNPSCDGRHKNKEGFR